MAAKIFRINYKSDFILTLNSDAGWMTPFCIKFWTGVPSQAFFVGWDGETYTHCAYDPGEPTKLLVQFDDHHLPIGDLKFQIAYHFTVADFPNDTEDEVINPGNITTEIDGEEYQVMLDFTGETAPEIEFSLPAYANEAQRIANEEDRIAAEQQRIANEEARIAAEETRQQNEQQRIDQETARVNEFATLKSQSQAATRNANDASTLANQKAQLAADKAALADDAATLAIQKAQLAADKAALANDAAQLANEKATLAQQKAEYAQQQGGYAKDQGDYAKDQGDYAKAQGDIAQSDHERAETDHGIAVDDHTQAGNDHTRAEADHGIAANDRTQAGNDHIRAESDHGIAVDDHTQAGNDHTRAESDHGIAADDHTQAGNDHTRAESDHTRAESDHAAVEVYVDSLGAFDISAYHATGGVLAKYADLTAALGTDGANIPEGIRKGGMSVKFVQSSDNKYVQYRLMSDTFTTTVTQWEDYYTGIKASSSELTPQLSITDEDQNTIAEFENGNFRTKNFDSTKCPFEKQDNTSSQLNIQDENGNNVVQFVNGDIRTKYFDSKRLRLPLNNKTISIVGDSISTFAGYLVSDNADYQYTPYETKYPYQDIQSVEQTWWKQLLNETGAKLGNLCAWSGSYAEGFSTFTDSAFYACSDRRILDIGYGNISPDIIIVLIGVNDYGVVNCQIGDFTDKSTIPNEGDQNTFSNAYGLMIKKIISQYPNSKIFCCTILDVKNGYSTIDDTTYPELNNKGVSIYDMNQTIKNISDIFGCHLIDLHSCGISYFNSILYLPDGLHPNAAGAKLIKNCVKKALLNSL